MATLTYVARPEYIGRNESTEKLYELEDVMNKAIVKVIEHRQEQFDESHWTEATPQTLRTILEGFDHHAAEVAAESFLKKREVKKEVASK